MTTATAFGSAADWTRRHVDAGRLPVAVLAIADINGIVDVAAFGTDPVTGRTAHVDDRFALYSITKPLVALTAMRAVERGLLTTETPLRDALPGFVSPEVTLAHLTSHTSGVADLVLGSGASPSTHGYPTTVREAIERAPLEFAPGTARRYANLTWEGVAALIEHATGRTFEHEFADTAASVGAEGLSFDTDDVHHVHGGERYAHDPAALFALRHPAAGAAARASDLLAIGRSLLAGDDAIVHRITLDAMLRPRTSGLTVIDPDRSHHAEDFGIGFNLPRHPSQLDHSSFGHGGWSNTQFWISRNAARCVVLLTNRLDAAEPDIGVRADELLNAAFTGR